MKYGSGVVSISVNDHMERAAAAVVVIMTRVPFQHSDVIPGNQINNRVMIKTCTYLQDNSPSTIDRTLRTLSTEVPTGAAPLKQYCVRAAAVRVSASLTLLRSTTDGPRQQGWKSPWYPHRTKKKYTENMTTLAPFLLPGDVVI